MNPLLHVVGLWEGVEYWGAHSKSRHLGLMKNPVLVRASTAVK